MIKCDTIKILPPTLNKLLVLYFFPLYAIIVEKSSIKKAPKLYFQNVAALHHIRILLINKLDFRRELYKKKWHLTAVFPTNVIGSSPGPRAREKMHIANADLSS